MWISRMDCVLPWMMLEFNGKITKNHTFCLSPTCQNGFNHWQFWAWRIGSTVIEMSWAWTMSQSEPGIKTHWMHMNVVLTLSSFQSFQFLCISNKNPEGGQWGSHVPSHLTFLYLLPRRGRNRRRRRASEPPRVLPGDAKISTEGKHSPPSQQHRSWATLPGSARLCTWPGEGDGSRVEGDLRVWYLVELLEIMMLTRSYKVSNWWFLLIGPFRVVFSWTSLFLDCIWATKSHVHSTLN